MPSRIERNSKAMEEILLGWTAENPGKLSPPDGKKGSVIASWAIRQFSPEVVFRALRGVQGGNRKLDRAFAGPGTLHWIISEIKRIAETTRNDGVKLAALAQLQKWHVLLAAVHPEFRLWLDNQPMALGTEGMKLLTVDEETGTQKLRKAIGGT